MKTIYSIFYCIFLTFIFVSVGIAQSESIYDLKSDLVKIETDYLDVQITTWERDYIQVSSEVKINMSDGGDKHELNIQNGINGIVVKSLLNTDEIEEMVITMDDKGNKTFTPASKWDANNENKKIHRYNYGYEVNATITLAVPENMKVKIETLYGDVNVNGLYRQIEAGSTYGMIEAKLENVSRMEKISLISTYEIIDLTLDSKSDATLNLDTSYGSVFSDLPLESNSKDSKGSNECSEFPQKYVLNNGSVVIDLESTYENIYVRAF